MKKLVFAFAMIFALSMAAVSCTDHDKKANSSDQTSEVSTLTGDTLNNAEGSENVSEAPKAEEVSEEKSDAAAPEEKSAPAEEVKAEGSAKSEEAK